MRANRLTIIIILASDSHRTLAVGVQSYCVLEYLNRTRSLADAEPSKSSYPIVMIFEDFRASTRFIITGIIVSPLL